MKFSQMCSHSPLRCCCVKLPQLLCCYQIYLNVFNDNVPFCFLSVLVSVIDPVLICLYQKRCSGNWCELKALLFFFGVPVIVDFKTDKKTFVLMM